MVEHTLPPARYERQDVSFGFLLGGACGVLALVLLCAFLVMWLYPSAVQDRRLPSALPAHPSPRLQTDPHAEWQHFLAAEQAQLNSTGWVDKAHGVAHIPVEDAMRQIAHDGIPDWPTKRDSKP